MVISAHVVSNYSHQIYENASNSESEKLSRTNRHTSFSTEIETLESDDEEIVKALSNKVYAARDYLNNYGDLLIFTLFTIIYMVVLYLQADSARTYSIAKAHSSLLPPGFTSNSPFYFGSADDIYDWLNQSIIQQVWADTKCGNGICDRPQETAAYGPNNRFGCASDCGTFDKTSDVSVSFATSFQSTSDQSDASWNLCMTYPKQFCWFEENQTFTGRLTTFISETYPVLSGNWSFFLNAPSGGIITQFIRQGNTDNGVMIGGCQEDYPETEYSKCRKACVYLTNCYRKSCLSGKYTEAVKIFKFCVLEYCLRNGSSSLRENNYTSLLNQSCAENMKMYGESLNGGDICSGTKQEQVLLAVDLGDRNLSFPDTSPEEVYKIRIWNNLGVSDNDRLYRLSSAVQRALYSWIKEECLVRTPKPIPSGKNLTAFLCTFLGGPGNLSGCTYTSIYSGKKIKLDSELLLEMYKIHKGMNLHMDQEDHFTKVLLWALKSVIQLKSSTVSELYLRLRQLDQAIVAHLNGSNCNKAETTVSMATNTGFPSVDAKVGESVKWIWKDNDEHSIKFSNELLEAFGHGHLLVSRNKICSPENIGLGAYGAQPTPCNLVDPDSTPPYEFSFTHVLKNSGIAQYSSYGFGDNGLGFIHVSNATISSGADECSSGCTLSLISNGRCDQSCNNPECLFDGGDCSCPLDEFGDMSCKCPAGQIHGFDGACCDGFAEGFISQPFFLHSSSGDDPVVENAEVLPQESLALIRTISALNRVLIGLHITQKRRNSTTCILKDKRFLYLQETCLKETSENPFGVNPVAQISSSLYDEKYLETTSSIYSNDSRFQNETLAFNSRGIPFGFYPTQTQGGIFQYFFDVNLQKSDAEKLLTYLKEGFFIDNATSNFQVHLATYNGDDRLFTIVSVDINVDVGGHLSVKSDIKSLSVEHYSTRKDWIRFSLELCFLIGLLINVVGEGREFLETYREKKSWLIYFQSWWNVADFVSIGIMIYGVILWTHNVLVRERSFKVEPRYNIYEIPLSSFNYWKVKDNGEMEEALGVFYALDKMSTFRGQYMAVQGINVFLMALRILKLLDFQPRMGLITRTFAHAGPDLLHFFIIWAFVFGGFTFIAHVVFGRLVDQFRTLESSLNSCFRITMGEDSVSKFLLQLKGWEYAAGVIFWWTFVAIVVYVVMNLLVAIVVDSYMAVKRKINMKNPKSLHEDLLFIAKNLARKFLRGRFSVGQQIIFLKRFRGETQRKKLAKKSLMSSFRLRGTKSKRVSLNGEDYSFQELLALIQRLHTLKEQEQELGKFESLVLDIVEELGTDNYQNCTTDNEIEQVKKILNQLETLILSLNAKVPICAIGYKSEGNEMTH